ncbi:hypothetical protein [Anaerobaca lacustris]|uniref:DNA primase n=1 Tax=Anaerobaca lacustris TaxID=3044600 RepID=A0AAW6TXS3_9BACT|nr:hypothetical protein [Sedimentisphaerales bacterium M17dextr]
MTNIFANSMSYGYIELAALLPNGKMVRGHYVRKGDYTGISGWRRRFLNTNVFGSVGIYMEPNNNSPFILPMHFDIDCPDDLEAARRSALTLCEMLMDRIRLSQDNLDIAFSGHKGFHISVAPEIFRAFHSPYTLGLYRRMARRARDAGVCHIDESIYTRKRIWRILLSRHSKSGLFKIPLSYEELRDISIDGIKKLAANPRPEDSLARHQVCEEAVEWYRRALAVSAKLDGGSRGQVSTTKPFRDGWRMPPCIKAIQEVTLPDGIRHQTYLSLARFYRYIGMHPDEIHEQIEALDGRHPIRDPDYIERTVAWASDHSGFPGCDDESLRQYCRPEKCFYAKLKNNRKHSAKASGE